MLEDLDRLEEDVADVLVVGRGRREAGHVRLDQVSRDAEPEEQDGRVIDGDPSTVSTVTDIWTFSRNLRSRDPNWTLVATRSPN